MTQAERHGTHPGVNLIGFAASMNGLGVYARMVADLLIAEGVPLNIVPIGLRLTAVAPDEDLAPYRPYFGREPVHGINLFVFGAEFGKSWFPKLREPMRMAERYNVLMPFWELCEYPDAFLQLRQAVQLFLAPTRFIQQGLMNKLDRARIDYLPTAALTLPPAAPPHAQAARPFRFFFNFDILSSVDRKQPGLLVRAYAELFGADPGTELVLKVNGCGHSQAAAFLDSLIELGRGAPGLKLMTDRLPRARMLELIAASDAYVSCHRSEGLGLGLLEAMAMGVPCIATGYGGNTDFMNRDNAILLRYELEEVRCPLFARILGKRAQWAKPAWSDLIRAMSAVRHDADLRARLSANGRRDARKYIEASWDSHLGGLLASAWRDARGGREAESA